MRLFLLLLFFVACTMKNKTFSQVYKVKRTELLEYLYRYEKPISFITKTSKVGNIQKPDQIIPVHQGNGWYPQQKIVKNNKGLYVLLDGTGQVYRASGISDSLIEFSRVDSTFFFGYNFDALTLSYKDTLLSIGGYGYWHTNGQIRAFGNGGEWLLKPVDKEVPVTVNEQIFFVDTNSIYRINFPYKNEALKNGIYNNKLTIGKIDLSNQTYKELGFLNSSNNKIQDTKNSIVINAANFGGAIFLSGNKDCYLLDFKNNMIYKNKNTKVFDNLIGRKTNYNPRYIFQIDDTIFFSSHETEKLNKFILKRDDFEEEGSPIYKTSNEINYTLITQIIITIITIVSLVLLLDNRGKTSSNSLENQEIIRITDISSTLFDQFETEIISFIVKEKEISVDQLNSFLGLSKKTFEIQKKVRNETINKINAKFKKNTNTDSDLIERTRSEIDKRFFNYFINQHNLDKYNALGNAHSLNT